MALPKNMVVEVMVSLEPPHLLRCQLFPQFSRISAGGDEPNITYWWILLVQFLLLRKEIQTVPERDLPGGAPFGDGQRQIAKDIKGVGVVGADGAMQRAAQLAWEQVCTGDGSCQWFPSTGL